MRKSSRGNPNHMPKGSPKGGQFCSQKGIISERTKDEYEQRTIERQQELEYTEEEKQSIETVKHSVSNDVRTVHREALDIDKIKARGNLSPKETNNSIAVAVSLYNKAAKNETEITKDVISVTVANGGNMYGLDFRLKSETSMAGKIGKLVRNKEQVTFKNVHKEIKDSIRYTAILTDNKFTKGYQNIKQELQNKGYKEVRCRNYFKQYRDGISQQKAVQCVYESPKGQIFEFQFHTYESQGIKELNHIDYEEQRQETTSKSRKAQLGKAMIERSEKIPIPKGVYTIREYE